MFLSGLASNMIQRATRRSIETPVEMPKVGRKMTIVEAPAKYRDLPVELPTKDYRPSRPVPEPMTLPGENLSILIGDDFFVAPKVGGRLNFEI